MLRNLLFTISIIILCTSSMSAQIPHRLSDSAMISLITYSPGKDLYKSFGHSAIRVNDPTQSLDVVYNYGIFDFDTEFFYLKFSTGKLLYMLAASHFKYYQDSFEEEDVNIYQHILNLNQDQKQALFDYLLKSSEPKNREYYYRFFEDNCATRIRDAFDKVYGNDLIWKLDIKHPDASYRQLYHEDLKNKQWEAAGLDFLLGSCIDEKKSSWHFMYKPNYLMQILGQSFIIKDSLGNMVPLVTNKEQLYEKRNTERNGLISIHILWALALLAVMMTIINQTDNINVNWFDFTLYFILGVGGFILLYLKLFSLHPDVQYNWNILWAFPGHLIIAFMFFKPKKSVFLKYYLLVTSIICSLLLMCWLWLPQDFHIAFAPIIISVMIRGWSRFRQLRHL